MAVRKPRNVISISRGHRHRRLARPHGGSGQLKMIIRYSLFAILLGGVVGFLLHASGNDAAAPRALVQERQTERSVYFRYCRDARAAGYAPMRRGEAGYRPALDADNDGVACEPYR